MRIRTAASVALVIFAVGLCFWLFVRPVLMPSTKTLRFVDEKQLLYVGNSEKAGRTFAYADFKDEVKEWSKMLVNFAPILTLLGAYLLRRRK